MQFHRARLPQLEDRLFLTDGGIETTLIYHDGLDLPDFAAFRLLDGLQGELALVKYFHSYLQLASRYRTGIVLETATWRASSDWGARLGHDAADLERLNQTAVLLLENLRGRFAAECGPIVISGCVGPRGDGYVADRTMAPLSAREARDYHAAQVRSFAATSVDLVSAITMTTAEEAIGVVLAAREAGLASVVSFTVETDGKLPTGQPLGEAIEQVDRETVRAAAYYMVNCAHPSHFVSVLDPGAPWTRRLRGVRVNASCRSHAELNTATGLDIGDIDALARATAALRDRLPHLTVFGGCCGTDHRHIAAMARELEPRFVQATALP